MTNEHTSLEKYTSHTLFSKGVAKGLMFLVCERWVGDGTDCHILTPSSSVLLQNFFLILLDCSTGVQRAQTLCLALALTTASCPQLRLKLELNSACLELQLTQTVCGTRLYNCLTPTCFLWASHLHRIQPVHKSRWYSDNFDRMHLFLDWLLGRRSICYITWQCLKQFNIA